MAIPGPGTAISINTIVGEFGGTVPHSISEYYRGGGLVPNTPGNAAIPVSGTIALGNFYGSANRNSYTLTISADTQNYDVYTNRGPAYIAGSTDITVQINPGVVVSTTSVPAYAMLVPSSFSPTDTITIVNNGVITGAGNIGGNGGSGNTNGSSTPGVAGNPGSAGGNAVYVNRPTTITNNGTIGSGGGGGGGGGFGYAQVPPSGKNPPYPGIAAGGGGGGGAGTIVGNGGSAGSVSGNGLNQNSGSSSGSSGTANTGGAGGSGAAGASTVPSGGTGGAGGGLGAAGSAGATATGGPGSGGAAGNYITGNTFVTWPATGTRLGNVA